MLLAGRDSGKCGFGEASLDWLSGLAEYTAIAVRNAQVLQQGRQTPGLNNQGIAALRTELAQLGSELQAAGEKLQNLADLLDAEG